MQLFLIIASTIGAAMMATVMILIRLRASQKPASIKKIILPPIMMSTGSFMFLFPMFRVPWPQVLEALGVGIIFSILLIATSRFEIQNANIYLIPSKAFAFVLFGLLALRIILKLIVGGSFSSISVGETSGMFFILALGMIFTWRLAMLFQFINLKNSLKRHRSQ